MMATTNTSYSEPMSLTNARRILEGRGGAVSTKEACKAFLDEFARLNGVINTQARIIADVRQALKA